MIGLTVRWSLTDAPDGVVDRLKAYVRDESFARFERQAGLRFKTWRLVEAEWFEGCYVFVDDAARARFQSSFEKVAAESAGSKIIGSAPTRIEPCDIAAVVEGPEGFVASGSL